MFEFKVFVLKFASINAFTSGAISVLEISALNHEARDQSVENAAFVVKGLAAFACAFFSCAKRLEIFSGFWDYVFVEFDFQSFFAALVLGFGELDFEKYAWVGGVGGVAYFFFDIWFVFEKGLCEHFLVQGLVFFLLLLLEVEHDFYFVANGLVVLLYGQGGL